MEANRCPFLGMPEDPDTRLDFPSPGNVCHKASPTGPIKLEYQSSTCLTGQHVQCPIYTAAQPVPVPEALLAASPRIISLPRSVTSTGRLPLVLGGVIVLGLILFVLSSVLGNSNTNASSQGSGLESTRPGLFGLPQTGGGQITVVPNATNALRHTTCPPPDGWVTYIVNPTDSLYRLSVVHAVPLESLQRANCMGDETVILPGQLIYVPFTPTQTPTVTATPTRFLPPASTATSQPGNPNPPPVTNPTNAPPTRAPTTAVSPTTIVPTTAVPPTRVPPTAVPTTAVPPTATTAPIIPPILPTLLPTILPTSILPPIFPTEVEPTNTPAPPSDPGSGGGNNGRSETIDCGGGTVTVDGNNNDVTITGVCLGVTVNGNNNQVTVPRGTPVQDRGKNNVITEG